MISAGAASIGAAGTLLHIGAQDDPNDKRLRPRATTVGVSLVLQG